ncbi:hypothetical protein GALMADRAFT_252049 [Galerina marginata CBS 339.88]|uniref:Crinkler effector protein N-terminal domain-containing protein n=1 Tax=Galerina marginata (strain CBS 339.88) TaxID=685588 RepID=A0A067SRW2_GALM3|nr:hypothetical protein GALMADRAFT_252049 [Galerina marginata CBS 339.88]
MPGDNIRLACLVLPDDKPNEHLFEVKIDDDESVMSLKKMVKDECAHRLRNVNVGDLVLWKCSIPDDPNLKETLNTIHFDGTHPSVKRMLPLTWTLSQHFPEILPRTTIHILVEVPAKDAHLAHTEASDVIANPAENTASSRKRYRVDHSHVVQSWQSKRLKKQLPSIEELIGVLKEPLLDSEKIPITEDMYTSFISVLPPDRCDEDIIGTLFTIGDFDTQLITFLNAIASSPPVGGTKASFHSFWDDNIRKPIEHLIPTGRTIRNRNEDTETRKLRPDYAFLLQKICPFRGEEKGSGNSGDPKAELAYNLNWVYEPAPYMLGYYCLGSEMTLAAITPPDSQGGKPKVHDLISLDLRWKKDRIANIRHLINLSTILPQLTELVRFPVDDFERFERQNCTVEITNTVVIKTYTCENAEAKVGLLRRIYEVIARSRIPNTDALVFAHKNVAHLSPRGFAGQPMVEKELRECVTCILESLIVAHRVPIYHRDIRWNNVIRRIEDHSKWFLIDWEDAAQPPTTAQPFFSRTSHSPAIFEDGHGADVDIWGVGYLIKTCQAAGVSMELRALGTRLCDESQSLSAEEALILVNSTQTSSV